MLQSYHLVKNNEKERFILSSQPLVITFDGPSGSGKGTLSQCLARHLNWHLLDSGAIYRIVALEVLNKKIDLKNTQGLKDTILNLKLDHRMNDAKTVQYFLNDKDVTDVIRSDICSETASRIAAIPAVREALFAVQRGFLRKPGLIADGRDMGTVIFPEAILKFYITASYEQRVMRRYNQLKLKGINVSLSRVQTELKDRDERDVKRKISPLYQAKDAIEIDTTSQTIEDSFEYLMAHVLCALKIFKGPLIKDD